MTIFINVNHNTGGAVLDHWPDTIGSEPAAGTINMNDPGLENTPYGLIYNTEVSGDVALTKYVDTGIESDEFYFRFTVDQNTMAANNDANVLGSTYIYNTAEAQLAGVSIVAADPGTGALYFRLISQGDSFQQSASRFAGPSSGEYRVEVFGTRPTSASSNDGILTLWINGSLVDTLSNIDNYDFYNAMDGVELTKGNYLSTGNTGQFLIDEFIIGDSHSDSLFEPGFRITALYADYDNLYVAALAASSLQLWRYHIETLIENGTVPSFGIANNTTLDDLDQVFELAGRPDAIFLYGLDGNGVQAQVSTDGGDTWTDISSGAWASNKVCIGLFPDPLHPEDLVVVFTDNDIYHSVVIDAPSWTKTGDAPATLRRAARYPIRPGELLLAAQAADTAHFTHNYGVSFEDVSDTIGTVNVIEVSREPE